MVFDLRIVVLQYPVIGIVSRSQTLRGLLSYTISCGYMGLAIQ